MARPVNVPRGGARPSPTGSMSGPQTYQGTTSGYGPTRGESVGYNPANPHAYTASQNAKAYSTAKDKDIVPPMKAFSDG
jgi:hypothetical protein